MENENESTLEITIAPQIERVPIDERTVDCQKRVKYSRLLINEPVAAKRFVSNRIVC